MFFRKPSPARIAAAAALVLGGLLVVTGRPAPAATGDAIPVAIQKGINFLTPDVVAFSRSNGCQACHRQGAALFGLSAARSSGFNVDTSDANGLGFLAARDVADQIGDGGWTHGGSLRNSKTSYAFFGLAGFDQYISTRYSTELVAAADYALRQQRSDGSWLEEHGSYPTTFGTAPITARMMVGIARARAHVDPSRDAAYAAALEKAAGWIRTNKDNRTNGIMRDNYQIGYALLGLAAAGVAPTDADVQFLVQRLLASTSTPTGMAWGFQAANAADEFNTGVALYGLGVSKVQFQTSPALQQAVNWLNGRQSNVANTDPSQAFWASGGFSSRDIPTTFALIGLAAFGELGVDVRAVAPERIVIDAGASNSQTVTFKFDVQNTGAFNTTDTYRLSVQGGLPGWEASLSNSSVMLESGATTQVTLTVVAPPGLPIALPVEFSVVATSQTNTSVSDSAKVTVITNPPPPVTGSDTKVTLVDGLNANVTIAQNAVKLSARVALASNNTPVTGPGNGVVTFQVAGLALGADNDPDGDGLFEISWRPGSSWAALGTQDFRGVYSGIDLDPPATDLKGSIGAGTVNVLANLIVVNGVAPESLRRTQTVDVVVDGSGFAEGVQVALGAGITVNNTTIEAVAMSGARRARARAAQKLRVNVTVAGDAELGSRGMTITNTDGSFTVLDRVVRVTPGVTITRVVPNNGSQAEVLDLVIDGEGFGDDPTVSLGTGITINSATVTSLVTDPRHNNGEPRPDHRLTVNVTIAFDAAIGARDLLVTNRDTTFARVAGGFTVNGAAAGGVIKVTPLPRKVQKFPRTRVNESRSFKFRIQNTGRGTLVGTLVYPGAPYTVIPAPPVFSLKPKAVLRFEIKFEPKVVASTFPATLEIRSNDRRKPSVKIKLDGSSSAAAVGSQ